MAQELPIAQFLRESESDSPVRTVVNDGPRLWNTACRENGTPACAPWGLDEVRGGW